MVCSSECGCSSQLVRSQLWRSRRANSTPAEISGDVNGSSNYDYFMQRSCFCIESYTRPGLVQVRSDVITAVTDAETLQPLDPQFFLTVDGLFDELQNAIDYPAFNIQSQFDDTFGYPTSIGIDFIQNVADDEMFYTASNLRIIPEPVSFQLAFLGMLGIIWQRPKYKPDARARGFTATPHRSRIGLVLRNGGA